MTRAFVLSGGASLGAIQVGMLHALIERGIKWTSGPPGLTGRNSPHVGDSSAPRAASSHMLTIELLYFDGCPSYQAFLPRTDFGLKCRLYRTEERRSPDGVGSRVAGWGDQPDRVFESREFLSAAPSRAAYTAAAWPCAPTSTTASSTAYVPT